MSYRPICDVWLLARPKVKYYGSYPGGFLERARALLGVNINDPVLHVCGGKVREYPYRGGFGPNDKTLDLDPALNPDFCQSAEAPLPVGPWAGILADPPYTEGDADHYAPTRTALPNPNVVLRNCLASVPVGGRVGVLHYVAPRPPKTAKFIALVAVFMGYGNRARFYSVFERRDKA